MLELAWLMLGLSVGALLLMFWIGVIASVFCLVDIVRSSERTSK